VAVIAHRGDHTKSPENTLAAYSNAILDGADYVEVDLRTTRDGHLVVLHDATVNRMTGDTGAVSALSYREIERMTIAPLAKSDKHTYHIPDFRSVLKLCKGHINIYLDFKDADVARTYRLIKAAGMEDHIAVYLNKKEQYGLWKKVAPQIPLIASLPGAMTSEQGKDFLNHHAIKVVDNAYDQVAVELLHKKKIAVWLDEEDKEEGPAVWAEALKAGADGLQTDEPEKLIQYLKGQGIR
jgi:glycerophosphoryl diester phosphodiesterase